jgi:hypothetical protein
VHLDILPQPDDSTCGPTCLHAVYRYYGQDLPLPEVIAQTGRLDEGGTLAVMLACDALRRGYAATIYSYNLMVFDPTWFTLAPESLAERLRLQAEHKRHEPKLLIATTGYLEFLRRGGRLSFEALTPGLIRRHLQRGAPILTGLSATYLYHCARERPGDGVADDVAGAPVGHFVVLCGYDSASRRVLIADPLEDRPGFAGHVYSEPIERVVGAILLGVLTHDANLMIIEPPRAARKRA